MSLGSKFEVLIKSHLGYPCHWPNSGPKIILNFGSGSIFHRSIKSFTFKSRKIKKLKYEKFKLYRLRRHQTWFLTCEMYLILTFEIRVKYLERNHSNFSKFMKSLNQEYFCLFVILNKLSFLFTKFTSLYNVFYSFYSFCYQRLFKS